MGLLARREHSRAELRHKLRARGHDPEAVEAALERLGEQGYQDDRRFAEHYVASRVERGFGPVRIRAELQERGVDPDLGREALEAHRGRWPELAEEARRRRFGAEAPADPRAWQRQARFLQYRGFDAALVAATLGRR